jgi:Fe-S-cluster containining protein
MTSLIQLHLAIDHRVQTIREAHPDWLCAKGCDHCCRRLAEIPPLTENEWTLLRAGLAALPPAQLAAIKQRIAALATQHSRPVVCPLLDQDTGACPVYAQRPVACRTYGFYVERDKGLYCHDIEAQVSAGQLDDVLWGNQDGVDQQLKRLGETHSLVDWFQRWAP